MTAGDYHIGDALDELRAMPAESAAVVHLDDAWARPKRGGEFGVEFPTHDLETTRDILAECRRILKPGGWLIADCDDFIGPRANRVVREEWGDYAATYDGGGYVHTGGVTYVKDDGSPDASTPGEKGRPGGYRVEFVAKAPTSSWAASVRQTARHPRWTEQPEYPYGWGSVKPVLPYRRWLDALADAGEHVVIPCAGTAPAAIAAELLGLEWTAIDCEPEARDAYQARRSAVLDEARQQTRLGVEA